MDGLLSQAEARLNQDDRLIAAIRRGRNVVLPIHGTMQHPTGNDSADPSGMDIINSLNATVLPTGGTDTRLALARAIGTGSQGPLAVDGVLEPFEALASKAGAMGHMNLQADSDGRVRYLPLLVDYHCRLIPALPFQLALKHVGAQLKDISVEVDIFGQPHLLIEQLDLPTDGAYRMLFNHDRGWTRQRWFSCAEILNEEIDLAVFKDQIVLIGVTAEPAAPSYPVGLRNRASDVEIMANALAGILAPDRLSRPSWAPLRMGSDSVKPTFGRYEILRDIGRGAMGTVYLARDPKINRDVAIKTLAYSEVEPAELAEVKMRFSREAEAAGKLSHPNIVSIYDVGEEHDMAYIAMELLSGETLTRCCQKDNLLPISRSLAVIADVTAALDYAHSQGVVHRDIKPANIMLLANGRVKVTDFSIAQVVDASQTRTGVILGTPNYMSPEQVNGKRIDGRSDLKSTNHTYINGAAIDRKKLAHNDVIRIGKHTFKFLDESAEPADRTTKLRKSWIPGVYYTKD